MKRGPPRRKRYLRPYLWTVAVIVGIAIWLWLFWQGLHYQYHP